MPRNADTASFRAMVENSQDLITVLEADATIRYESPSLLRLLGYEPDELVGHTPFAFMHPDDIPEVVRLLTERGAQPGATAEIRYRMRHKNGEWRTLESHAVNLLHDPDVAGIIVNSHDVTDRFEAGRALEERERQLAEAQRIAHIGSWDWDIRTGQLTWSDELKRIYGLAQDEHVGMERYTSLLHEDDRERANRIVAEAFETKQPFSFYHRIVRPDGEERTLHGQGKVVIGPDGTVERMIGTGHDVTESQLTLRALRESERRFRVYGTRQQALLEKERARISREVHDVLGQSLTAIRMDIAWLRNRLSEKVHLNRLAGTQEVVDETIKTVRRIAGELRPGILDDLGLSAAMEWHAGEFSTRSGIRCTFEPALEHVVLDADRATALYRIFQELLTNVARHAAATQVSIALTQKAKRVELVVQDDGCGMPSDPPSGSISLGLLGIRERLLPWNGTLEIDTAPDAGTRMIVTLSLD